MNRGLVARMPFVPGTDIDRLLLGARVDASEEKTRVENFNSRARGQAVWYR